MTEVLKMVKKCKMYQIRGPRKARPLGFDQKICPGGGARIRQFLKICLLVASGDGNAWN